MTTSVDYIACSACFSDTGLQMDAAQLGTQDYKACPNCSQRHGFKLSKDELGKLAHRFFVWGSLVRCKYGSAPRIQFNTHQKTSITPSSWLQSDINIFEQLLGVGFFHYGPRLWMVGEVEPLKALQEVSTRSSIIERILTEYPETVLPEDHQFYRIRVAPSAPVSPDQYDSPPIEFAGRGRLDSHSLPVLYGSSDLEICVHECRVSANDEVFVATLSPTRPLRLLDLSAVLVEDVTEFESLDMAVHMLFLAADHAYPITRDIAEAAQASGFDGIIYPSYFSLLRLGNMPLENAYGLSVRRFPSMREHEQAKAVPNLALFGYPVRDGIIEVDCINRLILSRVKYDFHFGPAQC